MQANRKIGKTQKDVQHSHTNGREIEEEKVPRSVSELRGGNQKVNREAILIWSQLLGLDFKKMFVFIKKIWGIFFSGTLN